MNLILILLLCILLTNAAVISDKQQVVTTSETSSAVFPLLPIADPWSKNEKCRNDSRQLLNNLQNSTIWALQMLEASARSAVGVLKGRVYQLGDYDECIETVSPVQGRYCLVTVTVIPPKKEDTNNKIDILNPTASVWDTIQNVEDPFRIDRHVVHWALCVPASCSYNDVQASIDRHLAESRGNSTEASVSVSVDDALCRMNDEEDLVTPDFVAFCTLAGLLVLVVISSTVFDYSHQNSKETTYNHNEPATYFLCFSIKRNLLELSKPESTNDCLNSTSGVKFLSMCLIILTHRLGTSTVFPIQNYESIEKQTSKFSNHLLYQVDMVVDTFFVISGLMVSYICLYKGSFNIIKLIILRYIRLTPVYMMVVFFCSSVMYNMGDGPLWKSRIGMERDACRENWWTNLLYINNYVKTEKMCMVHSWFLPCDMHFFIVGLFLVKLLQRSRRVGCTALIFATIVSIMIPFTITFVGEKDPILFFHRDFLTSPRTSDNFLTMYMKSHARASPYFVGVATGYLLYSTSHLHKTFTIRSTVGTFVACIICFITLLPGHVFYGREWKYNVIQAASAAGLRRFVWAVGVAVFIVSVVRSKNSVIGSLLSSSPVITLSKLTFNAYLVHFIMQIMKMSSLRTSFHMSEFNLFHSTMGDIVCALLIALLLYLTVEAPIRLICRHILRNRRRVAPPESDSKLTSAPSSA